MSPTTIVLLSSLLTYGVPLALAVYQIWSLRRPSTGNDGPPPPAPDKPHSPKPLPDCLLPKPVRAPSPRVRVLENA